MSAEHTQGGVVEQADTPDSSPGAERREGSTPSTPTTTDLATRMDKWADLTPEGSARDLHRAAAVSLRALEEGIRQAVRELDYEHDKHENLPWCRICGTADGSWPCVSRMIADDLRRLVL